MFCLVLFLYGNVILLFFAHIIFSMAHFIKAQKSTSLEITGVFFPTCLKSCLTQLDKDITTIYKHRFYFSNTKTHFWLQNHNYFHLLWSEKMFCKIYHIFTFVYNCIFPKILHSPWNYENLLQVWLSCYSFLIDITGFQKSSQWDTYISEKMWAF